MLIVQDVWPDSVVASGFLTHGRASSQAVSLLGRFTAQVYEAASRIVVISEAMRELLLDRGVPEEKLRVIYNWAAETHFAAPVDIPPRSAGQPLRIMYAGSMGHPQGLSVILRALARLPQDDYHLDLVGSGTHEEALRREVNELRLSNVAFLGRKPLDEMPQVLAGAHVHLVSLTDHPLFSVPVPHKIQSLMLAGLPIVASVNGEAAGVIERSGAGWVVPAGDPVALSAMLSRLRDLPVERLRERGAAGRAFYFDQMSRAVGYERLAQAVRETAGGR